MTTHSPDIDMAALAAEGDAVWFRDELAYAWRAAQDEAVAAYRAWHESRGASEYAVYRAAQDRADHAQDVLAGIEPVRPSGRGRKRSWRSAPTRSPDKRRS